MTNSQSITPALPVLNATKTNPPPSEMKASNTFNQVFKNEIASKTKKSFVEPPKTTISNPNKSHTSTATNSIKVNNTESQGRNEEKIDDDESNRNDTALGTLNDTAALLNFVNNINTFTQPNNAGTEQDSAALDAGKGTAAFTATPILDMNFNAEATNLAASTKPYAASQELLNGAPQEVSTNTELNHMIEMALGAQSENTNAPIAATPSTSATVIPMAVNQAPPTNPSTPNDQTLIEADVAIASKAQVNADTKRLADTPQTGSANLNDTNRVTEINTPVTPLSANNETSTNVSELSGDKLSAAEAASNATTNVANDPAMSNQGGTTATIETSDVSSNLETISAAATANLNAVEKSVMQVTDSRSQEVQNSFNLSQTIPAAKMPGVSAAPSTKPEMTLAASARTDTTVSSAKTLDVNHATVTPAVNPATPQVSEKNTTTNLRPDNADFSLSGVGTNALFSDKLSAQFSQVQQEQNVLQKSEAIDEFAISAAKPEVIAAPPAIQTVMAAASSLATEHIGARFGTKAWDQAIGQKIVWMVAGGEQTAQLTLNPPDLGPVQVVLSISDSFVDASFVSSHLDVREAIEAAAPKLREMMDNAGISLSGFSVSADSAQSGNAFSPDKSQQSASSQLRNANKVDATVENTTQNMPTSRPSQAQGLVDTFA